MEQSMLLQAQNCALNQQHFMLLHQSALSEQRLRQQQHQQLQLQYMQLFRPPPVNNPFLAQSLQHSQPATRQTQQSNMFDSSEETNTSAQTIPLVAPWTNRRTGPPHYSTPMVPQPFANEQTLAEFQARSLQGLGYQPGSIACYSTHGPHLHMAIPIGNMDYGPYSVSAGLSGQLVTTTAQVSGSVFGSSDAFPTDHRDNEFQTHDT